MKANLLVCHSLYEMSNKYHSFDFIEYGLFKFNVSLPHSYITDQEKPDQGNFQWILTISYRSVVVPLTQ